MHLFECRFGGTLFYVKHATIIDLSAYKHKDTNKKTQYLKNIYVELTIACYNVEVK